MLDFGTLPPEITSARMYSGPGSGPMMVAASAWDSIAAQLHSFSLGYSAALEELRGHGWSGPASDSMAAAAASYVAWATTTATLTAQVAGQVRAAAAAYDTAHAATVPPALVEANRTKLMALVATNILGQNTAMIAAVEAAYAEMWAQDAQAMYGYAASAAAATALAPFHQPPQTTSAAGQSVQAAAVNHAAGTAADSQLSQVMSAVPQQLHTLSTAAAQNSAPSGWESALTASDNFNTLTGPAGLAEATSRTATSAGSFGTGIYRSILQGQGAIAKALPELAPAATTGAAAADSASIPRTVLASVARAEPIGGLSVPPKWAAATPEPTTFAEPPWLSEVELAEASSWEPAPATGTAETAPMAGMGPLAGPGAMVGAGRPTVSSMLRVAPRRFSMPRPAAGG